MKTRKFRQRLCIALIASLAGTSYFSAAEDIDLFVGSATSTTAMRPNVLIILDNSANWSAASQHWPGGVKQGQSELASLRTVVGEASDRVNLGLMLFTPGSGTNPDGAYVRYAIRQMDATNKAAFQELIGTSTCTDGSNSLNGTPNCLYKNYDTATEKVGTAKTNYSAALFEAFKYFGGYTDPARARSDTAGSPVDATHFGALRYSGDPDSKSDPAAFDPQSQRSTYATPINSANSCAKNYIIFIGNGFPTQDSPSTLLSGINGTTTQLTMPQFTTTTASTTPTIGSSCGTGNNTSQRISNCTSNISQTLKNANPADDGSYVCTGTGTVDATTCPGTDNRKFDVQATVTTTTVTPTGTSTAPSTSDARYTDEWSKYLFTTDVSSAIGQQNVRTYTVDVFKDAQDSRQTSLLYNMAKVGGGRYYQASSESAILNALREILVEIQAENSVFAAAALPVSATNRAQNENQVFFGMFRPDSEALPRWMGNLKRYQVGKNTAGALVLADRDGNDAIAGTGFFNACASSYWTTDSGTYWNFSPNAIGECTTASTGIYSDLPDGPLVEKGGAADVLRKGNNPAATATYAVNRTMYTCSNTSACPTATSPGMVAFNSTNVSSTAVGATDATDHTRVINYTLGYDVGKVGTVYGDENQNGSTTDTRPSIHGDIVHARPLPVNYGGTTGVVAYYGTNDGTFRAVRTSDGVELWSFIAPEHHASLRRLTENSPLINYANLPSGLSPTPTAKSYFFDGSAGLYQNADNTAIWVFPTMRRGGRMIYAFDVTTPTAPTLKWRVGCPNLTDDTGCTSGYSDLGQTWSTPSVARIKGYNSGADPVLIVGGGYDSCEDSDVASPSCGSAKGRKVYVINANTGAVIASFSTDRSVAADIALIDRDFDGLVDHAYITDTGGSVYRIDFVNPSTVALRAEADWTIQKIASVASGSGRKFLFQPSVLYAGGKSYLAFGSGDRERPLLSNYPYVENVTNRFYMFVDSFSSSGTTVNLDGSALVDNTSSSTCITPTSTYNGWRIDLAAGRGEQTVTSSLISGGRIFFNTHRATTAPATQCSGDLGEARGYNVNLLCGDRYSVVYSGIGLAISPVQGTVTLASGEVVTFVLGGASDQNTTSPFPPGKVAPAISQRRSRAYWYRHGDK